MTGSVRMRFGRTLLGAAAALAVAVPLLTLPTPALAWWHGGGWGGGWRGGGWGWNRGCCWRGGWGGGVVIGVPPVYAAPPPVYYARPPAYYPAQRYWVPPHWNGPYWVPGHWA